MKKSRIIGAALVVALWAALAVWAWCAPAKEFSDTERRALAQAPTLTGETLLSGKFMREFEAYTLDQFPLREQFRGAKALFSRYVLAQKDNNGLYMAQGHIAELEYPLDTASVSHALKQFQTVYELYLEDSGCRIFSAVVPDKGYYLAEANGYPAMDYEGLFETVEQGMPWARYVDITGCLSLEDYYTTDTHWRQEALFPVAQKLAEAMGITAPRPEDFTVTQTQRPFYGVYYGQAALPAQPDRLYLLENETLNGCAVYDYTTDTYGPVYDLSRLEGQDPYEVYLSGAQSLLRIENPKGKTDRELILFRDSFGSSLAPLLAQEYKAVTLVDIRYISPQALGKYVDFAGKDVLFLYSSLVLNKNLI